jgi:Putative restriction endonuclease
MAPSSSATGKNTPHDAPLLRQPPPSIDELARCNEEIGLLKPEDWPQVDHLVTEDDTPVDNIYAEKQQRLLTRSLYDAWQGPGTGRPFIAMANVGLFYGINRPPQVPDVLVSLDVALPGDIWTKRHRSYMIWEYGKPPEVVIEIVSNKIGGEDGVKLRTYARMGVAYYVIYDPTTQLSDQVLRLYELRPTDYVALAEPWLPGVELGLMLWQGTFEDREDTWLRWCNREGQLLLTGTERAEQERQRAEHAEPLLTQERQRAERLAELLRRSGIDPEQTR